MYYSRYGFLGSIRLVFSLIYTKFRHPQAKLIRLPFDIRNSKYIKIGEGFTSGFGCRIESFPIDRTSKLCISFGKNVQINDYVHISSVGMVSIGNNVLMASKIYISDHNHGSYTLELSDSPLIAPIDRQLVSNPVVIEDDVWIGESACILPGVTVGKGSIIGAMSIVTKDIPANCIAVGNPARVVKIYDFESATWITVNK